MSDLVPWLAPWSGRVLTLGVLLAGLALAWRWGRGRKRSEPTCPQCRYSRRGIGEETPCPECGHVLRQPRDAHRRVRRPWLAVAALLLAVSVPGYTMQLRVSVYGWAYYTWVAPFYWLSPEMTIETLVVEGVEFRVVDDRRWWESYGQTLRIFRRRELVASWTEHRLSMRPTLVAAEGDGAFVVVDGYTGGAHCCASSTLVRVRNGAVEVMQSIATGHSDVEFVDLDKDGVVEAELYDWTFAYWETSFASSPAPRVRLKFDGRQFVADAALMREPPPGPEELGGLADGLRDRLGDLAPLSQRSEIWAVMLDLIYSGHADLAWRFCDEAWPGWPAGKASFHEDFYAQLRNSPYFDVLIELNGVRLRPPDPPPRFDAAP